MILLASVSSGILAIWPNIEIRRAWTIADRRGYPVVRLTSSFRTWWYHLIPNNFRKHHWSRASILSTSLLVTAQHSEPYRKIGRMHVLYNFSLVGMVIDFQICLSRFCIAVRVMALRELWVDEWTREPRYEMLLKLNSFLNNFSNFLSTLLTMPQKFTVFRQVPPQNNPTLPVTFIWMHQHICTNLVVPV